MAIAVVEATTTLFEACNTCLMPLQALALCSLSEPIPTTSMHALLRYPRCLREFFLDEGGAGDLEEEG
jgi:hypothetical protein